MRILYLTNGQTSHDLRFAASLAQTPHEVFILSLQGIVTGWPVKVTPVNWEPVKKSLFIIQLQAPKLKKVIESIKPDVVHAGPVQGPAYLAAVNLIHPLVTMSWGSDLMLEAERSFQTRRITRFTLSQTDVLVGDSKCILEKARKYGFKGPYFQFPWGVDLFHFSPAGSRNLQDELGWQENTVLLSMRSFEKLYDVDCIIQAFTIAAEKRPDLRLKVFGKGSREGLLRKLVAEAGLSDKVHFGGVAALENLPDVYRSADLYISGSHSDGASVSLMEALACGLPALVSNIPGNAEWIEQGVNGWRFTTGNAEDLAGFMVKFDKDSPEVNEMRQRNRVLAEERADWSKNFPVLLQAYEKAIELRRERA